MRRGEREGGGVERETERQRQRQRETDRQIDTDRPTDRQTDRQTDTDSINTTQIHLNTCIWQSFMLACLTRERNKTKTTKLKPSDFV